MNYRQIHDDIIARAQSRVLEGYSEKHHIVPRCMDGSGFQMIGLMVDIMRHEQNGVSNGSV